MEKYKRLNAELQSEFDSWMLDEDGRKVTKKIVPEKSREKLYRMALNEYGLRPANDSRAQYTKAVNDILALGEISEGTERFERAVQAFTPFAETLVDGYAELEPGWVDFKEEYADAAKSIKAVSIVVPAEIKSEFGDGWKEFQRHFRGTIVNKETLETAKPRAEIDSLYKEITEAYPGALEGGAKADRAAMLRQMSEFLDHYSETKYIYPLDEYRDDAVRAASEKLLADILMSEKPTFAARLRDKYDSRLKNALDAQAQRMNDEFDRKSARYEKRIGAMKDSEVRRLKREMTKDIFSSAKAIIKMSEVPSKQHYLPDNLIHHARRAADAIIADSETAVHDVFSMFDGLNKDSHIDRDFIEELSRLRGAMTADSKISELSPSDLNKVRYALQMARQYASSYGKVLHEGQMVEAAELRDKLARSIEGIGGKYTGATMGAGSLRGKLACITSGGTASLMSGETFLHSFGKEGDTIWMNLREAQDAENTMRGEYISFMIENFGDDAKNWRFYDEELEYTTAAGETFKASRDTLMEIYVLAQRPDAKSHLESGGVHLWNDSLGKYDSKGYVITDADIEGLRDAIGEDAAKKADGLAAFLQNDVAGWINKAWKKMYGFERFHAAGYFPMSVYGPDVDSAVLTDSYGGKFRAKASVRVTNKGYTKSVQKGAQSGLEVGGIFAAADKYIIDTTKQAAWGQALTLIDRVFVKGSVLDRAIGDNLGDAYRGYMSRWTERIAGEDAAPKGAGARFLHGIMNHYKASAVAANFSTMAKQPLSYIRAADVIEIKYLTSAFAQRSMGGKAFTNLHREMLDNSAIARIKEGGASENAVSRSLHQMYDGRMGFLDKTGEFMAKGAELADTVTWVQMWQAARLKAADMLGDGASDEAVVKKTAQIFDGIISQTQVVDSVLDRAPIMADKDSVMRIATMFMNEPVKAYNTVLRSAFDLRRAIKMGDKASQAAAGKKFARTAAVFIAGTIAEAAVSATFSILRDKRDDTEDEEGRWLDSFGSNIVSNVLGITPYTSFAADIYSYITGASSDSPLDVYLDPIKDVADAIKALCGAYGESNKYRTTAGLWLELMSAVSQIGGLPFGTVRRDFEAAARLIFHLADNFTVEYAMDKALYNQYSSSAKRQVFMPILISAARAGKWDQFDSIARDLSESDPGAKKLIDALRNAYKVEYLGLGSGENIPEEELDPLLRTGGEAWLYSVRASFGVYGGDSSFTGEKELARLIKAAGENSGESAAGLLPSYSNSFTVDGEEYKMDDAEYARFCGEAGERAWNIIRAMVTSSGYGSLTEAEKRAAIKKAYDYSKAMARYKVNDGYDLSGAVGKKFYDLARSDAAASKVAERIIATKKGTGEDRAAA